MFLYRYMSIGEWGLWGECGLCGERDKDLSCERCGGERDLWGERWGERDIRCGERDIRCGERGERESAI